MGVTPPLWLALPVPPRPGTSRSPLPEPQGGRDHPEPLLVPMTPAMQPPQGLTCWRVFSARVSGTGCALLSSPGSGSGIWRGSRWSSRSCCAARGWATGSSSAPRRAGSAWPMTPSCCWAGPGGASPSPCEGRTQCLLASRLLWLVGCPRGSRGPHVPMGEQLMRLCDPSFWLGCIPDYKAWGAHPLGFLHPGGCCRPTQPSRHCPSCCDNRLWG